jgi:hypothetical protein
VNNSDLSKKPKILMITGELDFGGVETAAKDRLVALREVGYEIEAACFNKFGGRFSSL